MLILSRSVRHQQHSLDQVGVPTAWVCDSVQIWQTPWQDLATNKFVLGLIRMVNIWAAVCNVRARLQATTMVLAVLLIKVYVETVEC